MTVLRGYLNRTDISVWKYVIKNSLLCQIETNILPVKTFFYNEVMTGQAKKKQTF